MVLSELELMELEVPNSIVYFLHNKNTHKLYTRGNPDMDEIVKEIRREIYWYDNNITILQIIIGGNKNELWY